MRERNLIFAVVLVAISTLQLAGQTPKVRYRPSLPSQRALLGTGSPAQRFEQLASSNIATRSAVDTLRILALRVDFVEDNNTLTTGNGKFMLDGSDELFIDPPPHNRAYFEDQLTALSNYYSNVSRGRLAIAFDVFPSADNETYTVSQSMSAYVPAGSEQELDNGLSNFFEEALQVADASGAVDFAQYEVFLIFHAGVGGDFAFDFDPTPQDIPSVFLDFGTLQRTIGGGEDSFSGIAVNGGQFFVKEGIILPETQSQEGFEIGLLGTSALMFGNQLGLPILFNPDTGLPGIGVFGLMDQGSGNFTGLLPSVPCAWSRVFLGWEEFVEVRAASDLKVASLLASNPDKIYKIPIDSREYFLVENRQRDANGDGISLGRDANGTRVEFVRSPAEGEVLRVGAPIGVITRVDDYDYGLPGSGILIWHIDERVIRAEFAANRVNADPERRGVDLEEADGAQDIGQVFGFLSPGAGAENGVIEDMFWGGNEINLLVNASENVEFSSRTKPSSRANSGGDARIRIFDFSERDTVMRFSVTSEALLSGFPQFTADTLIGNNSPIAFDLDADGREEIILSEEHGTRFFVWRADGSKYVTNSDSANVKATGEQSVPIAVFAEPSGSRSYSPAVATMGGQRALIAVTDEAVTAYSTVANQVGRATSLFSFISESPITTTPLIVDSGGDDAVLVGSQNGAVYAVTSDGQGTIVETLNSAIVGLASLSQGRVVALASGGQVSLFRTSGTNDWQVQLDVGPYTKAPVVADLDQDGIFEMVTVSSAGELTILHEDGELTAGLPKQLTSGTASQLVVGDVNGNEFLEVVFTAENKIFALNHVGNLVNDFPVPLSRGLGDMNSGSPILVDLDNDDKAEIVVGTPDARIVAFHGSGRAVSGFPLPVGEVINSTPFVSDFDADGDIDLAVGSQDGFFYAFDLTNTYRPEGVFWGGLFGDIRHSNANLIRKNVQQPDGDLMPSQLVYNYPNPTEGNQTTIRYRLNSEAEVNIRIFDLAGEFVDELQGPGFAQVDNEIDWSLTNIESGVYLARVEARGSGKRDVAIIKIAVVK